jgi:hypothetical protein
MKILHILTNGPNADAQIIIDVHEKEHEVEVINLTEKDISYDALVDKIEQCDKVISW